MTVKDLLKVVFIFSASVCLMVSSASFTSTFQVNKVYDTSYGEVLSTADTRSKLECVRKCSETEICRSATFDSNSKSCKTNRWFADVSIICETGSGCVDPNALIYGEKHFETTIDQECRKDLDCVDSSSVCVLKTCQCEPGYSYDGTNYACVSSCTGYGTTFQSDIGKRLRGLNEIQRQHVSLEDCKSMCVSETSFVCKTFEYTEASMICCLHKYTALDRPDAYEAYSHKNLYTRDCDNS